MKARECACDESEKMLRVNRVLISAPSVTFVFMSHFKIRIHLYIFIHRYRANRKMEFALQIFRCSRGWFEKKKG